MFIPHLCLAVTTSEFREDLDIHITRMNGLSCGEESMTIIFSRFDTVPACDRQTDGRRTDAQPISITCFSIADARKYAPKSSKAKAVFQRFFVN